MLYLIYFTFRRIVFLIIQQLGGKNQQKEVKKLFCLFFIYSLFGYAFMSGCLSLFYRKIYIEEVTCVGFFK